MMLPVNISKNLRLLLTAITLLLVVGLNNREVPAYVVLDATTAPHQVNKAAAEQHGTIKQKVSLEGTASYLVLELAALPARFLHLDFPQPAVSLVTTIRPGITAAGYFKTFFSTAIQPNAP